MRGASARLVRIDYELVQMLAGEDFVRCRDDGVGKGGIESARFLVGQGRRLLDPHLSDDEGLQRSKATDWEILNRPQRLHAVEGVGRHFERAERIFFGRLEEHT